MAFTLLAKAATPSAGLFDVSPVAAPPPGTNLISDLQWNNLIDILDGVAVDKISAASIAGGLVSDAEYDFLNGVTSNIQTQLNTLSTDKEDAANKGAVSGYAGLDASQLLLLANFPTGTGLQVLRRNAGNTALEFFTLTSTLDSLTDTTITAAAAHEVLVRNAGNSAWVNELLDNDNLAAGTFNNITGLPGVVTFLTDNTTASLTLEANHTTPAAAQAIGELLFVDDNSIGTQIEYARIQTTIRDPASGSEQAGMSIRLRDSLGVSNYLLLNDSGFPDEIVSLKQLNMLNHAIVFTNDTADPPANSLHWIGFDLGSFWHNAPTAGQHDFAINGTSTMTVEGTKVDLHFNDLVLVDSYQFGNDNVLPATSVQYIQYGNTVGLCINGGAADIELQRFGNNELTIGNTQIDFHANNLANLGETRLKPGNASAQLALEADHTTPVNGSQIATIDFDDDNSVAIRHTYAQFRARIEDPTSGLEDGELFISMIEAGALVDYVIFNNANDNNVNFERNVKINRVNNTPVLQFFADHTTPAAGQIMGQIDFRDDNSLNSNILYGTIQVTIQDPANPVEEGGMEFKLETNGTFETWIELNNLGDNVITFNKTLDMTTNFVDIGEIAAPANPAANVARIYARDDATVTKLYFRDSAGTETELGGGGGAQTPWTSDIDADGFDLTDLSNLEFRATTLAPAGTVAAIYYNSGSDITVNVPSGNEIEFTVNDVLKVSVIGNGLNIAANESILWGLNGNQRISNDTGGFTFETQTGDIFEFQVENVVEYELSATQMDFNSNNIVNAGTINTHTIPGGSSTFAVIAGAQTLTDKTLGTGTIISVDVTLNDGVDFIVNATTGSSFGTATTQKISFYGVTPVVQPTALTAQDTTITHTAPSVADFAIQDLTTTTPFGFVTKDEGNTVLQVIANLQTRVDELETKLQALGLLA